MKVLVACEYSGTVRDAFLKLGHEATSCDLLPTDSPGPHYQGDVQDILHEPWDLLIAHPPCTYICRSGLHWNNRGVKVDGRDRSELTEEALAFARMFIDGPQVQHIPRRAVENPVGLLSTRFRKPDQIIQPYHFGHDASKQTCLWLVGLPKLVHTSYVRPRLVGNLPRWSNQTDSGNSTLPPSKDRWKLRSATYSGIAVAMADRWNF